MDSVSKTGHATPRPLFKHRLFCRNERVARSVVPDVTELEPGFDGLVSVFVSEAIRVFFGVSWDIGYFVCIGVTSAQLL
jgi:hypothetical protein